MVYADDATQWAAGQDPGPDPTLWAQGQGPSPPIPLLPSYCSFPNPEAPNPEAPKGLRGSGLRGEEWASLKYVKPDS